MTTRVRISACLRRVELLKSLTASVLPLNSMSQLHEQPRSQINTQPSNSNPFITLEELLIAPLMPENLPHFEIIKECEVARDLGSHDSINSENDSDYDDIEEVFPCDCRFDENFNGNPESQACGAAANCINRELFIECDAEECPCRDRCQNQRFHRRQYAKVKVVETKGKGFGLFTCEDLKPDSLVMEYVGEIVNQDQMNRRAELYAFQGQTHFYFMTLRPNQIIDATRRGNLSRFLNHSCSPNCKTQKWIVDGKIKIGLFTLKAIKAGTELTFDYKFVRFGTEPQKCLCGEANCTGFIGTSLNDSPDKKKKRKKKMSNVSAESSEAEFNTDVEEEQETNQLNMFLESKAFKAENIKDMALIVKHLLQAEDSANIKILLKIVLETTSSLCLRKFLSLHGLKLLKTLFTENCKEQDREIVYIILNILMMLPIGTKNTIEDSGWVEKLEKFKESLIEEDDDDDDVILKKVDEILKKWNSLERIFTIPKKTIESASDYLTSLTSTLKPTLMQQQNHTKSKHEHEVMSVPQEFSSALHKKRNWKPNEETNLQGKEIGSNANEGQSEDYSANPSYSSRSSSPIKKISLTSLPTKSRQSNPAMIPDPLWLTTQTPDGRTYYYHQVTRETSWDLPMIPKKEGEDNARGRDRESERDRNSSSRDRDRTFSHSYSYDHRYPSSRDEDRYRDTKYIDRNHRDRVDNSVYNRRDERSFDTDSRVKEYSYNSGAFRKQDNNLDFDYKNSSNSKPSTGNAASSALLEGVGDSSQLAAVIERAKARRGNSNQIDVSDEEVKTNTLVYNDGSAESFGFEKVHLPDAKTNSKMREEISGVVIRFLSHYKEELGDDFKELARKNTHKILEKESNNIDLKTSLTSFELNIKKKIKIKSYLAEVLKSRNIKLKREHESLLK